MNNPAPPWLKILRTALDREYAARPRIATLATADADHHPRARTVILRQIDDDAALWMVSSREAEKNHHLRQTPFAEIVLYLPVAREQFRLAGCAKVIGQGDNDALRQQFWQSLSDAARATFFWPIIGQPAKAGENIPAAIASTVPMPATFELIALFPNSVEHLATASLPHQRTRWQREKQWTCEQLNP